MSEIDDKTEAVINPEVLKWAREEKTVRLPDAAEIAGLTIADYEAVEEGEKKMTIAQLRRIAEKLDRPIAFFYLPAPPDAREESSNKRQVRVYQEAIIEVNAEFTDEEIRRALVFGFFDENTGEVYGDGEKEGFRVAEYLKTVIGEDQGEFQELNSNL